MTGIRAAILIPLLLMPGPAFNDSPTGPSSDVLQYSVAPVFRDNQLRALRVGITFDGDADGETVLHLPAEWAGSDSLWRHIDDISVTGASIAGTSHPQRRVLRHAAGARMAVSYTVRSAHDSAPGFAYEKARPLILGDWFLFHGEGLFAVPEGRLHERARFSFTGFPRGWRIASDLDHLANGGAGRVSDIVESVALGGAGVVVATRDIGGASLRIATHGSWRFDSDSFADAIHRIVVSANRMWGDQPRDFLVTLAPLGGGDRGVSTHGTGRGDAFSVASTAGFQLATATRFLAHEYLHTWFPHAFGSHMEPDEPRGYWFSEGFTDFFAGRVLVAAGLWSFADYAADLNTTLARHGASSARDVTAAEIIQRFWSDYRVQRVPYDRGHLFAHVLEARLRAHSNGAIGLREILSAQRERAAQGRAPAAALFAEQMRAAGLDIAADVDKLMERGAPLLLPEDLFGDCASIETIRQAQPDEGVSAQVVTLQRFVPAEGATASRCLKLE